ncbi:MULTISPECIES: aldehyde dehydrogenase family protein [unclassified Mycobacterium]|uniref:aldehyde dehydrogenase family protein n=1 Tax=unclassified Mycobacterium TaxID=2642494 RepID=UPI00089580A5|nr:MULTISPECIES: aldehyde dehydrogenase family protein [unclassified Mycobacterium]SEA62098.1 Acyl-CoA reductase [Mycobacterium sp. 283mftsu]
MTIEVNNPADGRVVGVVPDTSPVEVAAVVANARVAQKHWEAVGAKRRARTLRALQGWIFDNSDRIADVVQSEAGKPRAEARLEVAYVADLLGYYAEHAPGFLADEHPAGNGLLGLAKRLTTAYRPYPVVGVITPWNYPLVMPGLDVIPALAAGAAVVLKPSEATPLSALELVHGWREIDAPPVFSVVTGAAATGAAVVEAVDYVQFTGSTRTGRRIAAACAEQLKPCGLELGGKDAAIVLADADLDRAVHGITWGGLVNAGQMCISVERVYVEAPVYDEFVSKLANHVASLRVGADDRGHQFDVGTLITDAQRDVVTNHVADAVAKGARILLGGNATGVGNFFEPTVLVDVDHSMACMTEETFGPMLPVAKVADEDEAIRLANDSEYGLSASVWTSDRAAGQRVARQLEVGAVNVNDAGANMSSFALPMGGWKQSGIGARLGGAVGVRKYCRAQGITEPRLPTSTREMFWFPYSPRAVTQTVGVLRAVGAQGLRRFGVDARGTQKFLDRVADETASAAVLWRAGAIPRDPRVLRASARASAQWGQIGGLPAASAAAYPDRTATIDDRGELTYTELSERVFRAANGFRAALPAAPTIGILCRNHADALVALFGAVAAGARVVLLNTDFSARQVDVVSSREHLDAIVYDDEFDTAVAGFEGIRWCAWPADGTFSDLLNSASPAEPPQPERPGSFVALTSGSTGTPKGVPRKTGRSLVISAGLLSKIPLRGNERVLVSAPVFHGWGLIVTALSLTLGSTVVLHRRFDATRVLDDLERYGCSMLAAVPTMLRRVLATDRVAAADLSTLRIVGSGGARLDSALEQQITATFGPVLYNLYGSTEAAYISIATPQDLAVAPGCAGIPPRGVRIRIADSAGRPLPPNTEGRILIRSAGQLEAYTDGRTGSVVDGYLDTGDRGHIDAEGRLFVVGRSDGMIVSGGENVYPEELELALLAHPAIADAAVTAVDDAEFGQRLRAYVVAVESVSLDESTVRRHVAAELPRSRMPRDIVFVDALPRTASGKVMRATLAQLQQEHS